MTDLLALIGYGLVAFFGVFLSAAFSGVQIRKYNLVNFLILTAISLAVQAIFLYFGQLKLTQQIYPLILHLPLILVLRIGYKKPWSVTVASVLLAYLCCQIPRWIASITCLFSNDLLYYHILYIPAISASFLVLSRHVVKPIQNIMNYSPQSALGLGLLPLLYYI